MQAENIKFTARSNAPQWIMAAGILFALLYVASSIVLTLLLAVLMAYFLDPIVGLLDRFRIPRAIGAILVLTAAMALVAGAGYFLIQRADDFASDWPRYSLVLRNTAAAVDRKVASFEKGVAEITPQPEGGARARPAVRIEESQSVRELLLRGIGSLYSTLLVAAFLPFLVFFMLAAKRRLWLATLHLFPEDDRPRVEQALAQVAVVLRGYMIGNALVALILVLASGLFFWMIHLDYPFLAGAVSGLLNLVPYLGAVLAWLPPFLLGMVKWKTIGPFLGVAGALTLFHFLALNLLVPALVGRRVRLNALAVTISLMFWGWLWGAAGFILAIPITATVKVVCDHAEGWQPLGRFLGARDAVRPKA
jgi:predicted PurR-regulated permease PerM